MATTDPATDTPAGPFAGILVLSIAAITFLVICGLWGLGRPAPTELLVLVGFVWTCGTVLRIVEVDRA